jgi:hypothetical protein
MSRIQLKAIVIAKQRSLCCDPEHYHWQADEKTAHVKSCYCSLWRLGWNS